MDVRPASHRLLEGVCVAHGCRVVCCSPAGRSAEDAVVEEAELFIIEADRGGLAVGLARRLRARAPAVPIAVVLTSWSECESEAQSTADFVMHAPLRKTEIGRMLEILESYGGWLPSPLLAAAYRSRSPD